MSLMEIEKAVDRLSPEELAKLAAYIAHRDNRAWDKQLEEDFARGGKLEKVVQKIDAEIDAGKFKPLPCHHMRWSLFVSDTNAFTRTSIRLQINISILSRC